PNQMQGAVLAATHNPEADTGLVPHCVAEGLIPFGPHAYVSCGEGGVTQKMAAGVLWTRAWHIGGKRESAGVAGPRRPHGSEAFQEGPEFSESQFAGVGHMPPIGL